MPAKATQRNLASTKHIYNKTKEMKQEIQQDRENEVGFSKTEEMKRKYSKIGNEAEKQHQ